MPHHAKRQKNKNETIRPRSRRYARSEGPLTRESALFRRAGIAFLAIFATLGACDVRKDEPIAECVTYASAVRSCFGDRIGARMTEAFAKAPVEPEERAALRERCTDGNDALARACR
jgi:hypothetical protein